MYMGTTIIVRGASILLAFCLLSLVVVIAGFRLYFRRLRKCQPRSSKKKIAFFHPYCSSGGGGERVLWKAIQALDELHSEGLSFDIVIYTVDAASDNYKETLFNHVQSRFSIKPTTSVTVSFAHLDQYSHFFDKATRFSLIAESWGTMKFAYQALKVSTPDVFIDTTGCAFTYLVARILAGCDVAAYVHYPTISTDMLQLVWDRRPTYNNDATVARSSFTTYIKMIYYALFAAAYATVGSMCRLVMVNSSWTRGHISFLWRGAAGRIHTVFPPCDTESLKDLPLERNRPIIVSIGQFRPEKDHPLQVRAFARFRKEHARWNDAKLVLVGSCRGADDEERVRLLRDLIASLDLVDSVEIVLNQPYSVVKKWFGEASVGLHTMWNEHFGIGVVEMMAAGLLVIAHNSGGPKADIVVPTIDGQKTGFLAVTEQEFATAMNDALSMTKDDARKTRLRARHASAQFSDQTFNLSFKRVMLESGLLIKT